MQFQQQDPRGMIALAIGEWLSAVEMESTSDNSYPRMSTATLHICSLVATVLLCKIS